MQSKRRQWIGSEEFAKAYPMSAIYSDVDINFHSNQLSTVTSMVLDGDSGNRRSSGNLPTQINQLIIDIQALDDAEVARRMRDNPNESFNNLSIEERMPRFTAAFGRIFDDLEYDRIENRSGHKEILFKKRGVEVPIEELSSGEKQIVYRGCFLLKDANATRGAFVFIDEPEISLHPTWQQKVMDYYKAMFTDASGTQTSQIFCVTHSPFIIHNDRRRNDKVIVLNRDESGVVQVNDKPEYYCCSSIAAVEDAFSIRGLTSDNPTVYLEGKTDEKYFTKACEVFGIEGVDFRWVGYIDDNGQERCTGNKSLSSARDFLIGRDDLIRNVCLFDCDTKHKEELSGNVFSFALPYYENASGFKRGIENALILDDVDTKSFYSTKTKIDDYGCRNSIQEFEKVKFCDYVCSKTDDELKVIFGHLLSVIQKIKNFFDGENTNLFERGESLSARTDKEK